MDKEFKIFTISDLAKELIRTFKGQSLDEAAAFKLAKEAYPMVSDFDINLALEVAGYREDHTWADLQGKLA